MTLPLSLSILAKAGGGGKRSINRLRQERLCSGGKNVDRLVLLQGSEIAFAGFVEYLLCVKQLDDSICSPTNTDLVGESGFQPGNKYLNNLSVSEEYLLKWQKN